MGKRFKGGQALAVVAVGADEHAEALVKSAASLCRRTGMRLRLVQVAEYWAGRSWPKEITIDGPLGEAIAAVEDESGRLAQNHLRMLAESVGRGLTVETSVLAGYPAECVMADAVANRAALIITGAAKGNHRFVPRGLSTALTLMADAPVPVLIIQAGTAPQFDLDEQHWLLADDLTENSERAVVGAFDLACAVGKVHLHHLHVNGLTEMNLRVALEGAAAASHAGVLRGISPTEVYGLAMKTLDGKLKARAPGRREVLTAHLGQYSTELRSGDVVEELHKAADRVRADLIVFGRHRAFRRKPFLIGQVPFYAMLSPTRPVLVVPGDV